MLEGAHRIEERRDRARRLLEALAHELGDRDERRAVGGRHDEELALRDAHVEARREDRAEELSEARVEDPARRGLALAREEDGAEAAVGAVDPVEVVRPERLPAE